MKDHIAQKLVASIAKLGANGFGRTLELQAHSIHGRSGPGRHDGDVPMNILVLITRLWRSFLETSEYRVALRYCEPWNRR